LTSSLEVGENPGDTNIQPAAAPGTSSLLPNIETDPGLKEVVSPHE
jgi:hypothetical protein